MKTKLAAFLFLTAISSAQTRHARFFPVGDRPLFLQEIVDGVAYEPDPPEGTLPPREVVINGKSAKLNLGSIGQALEVPTGKGPLELRKIDTDAKAEPWQRIATPEDGDFLTLLWRDAKTGTWAKARSLSLPDGVAAAPAGSARVVNVSPFAANVVIGTEKLIIAPGKSISRTIPADGDLPFQVLLQEKSGDLAVIHSTNLVNGPGERTLAVIYRADAESPRKPVKVVVRREPAPVPAPVKK